MKKSVIIPFVSLLVILSSCTNEEVVTTPIEQETSIDIEQSQLAEETVLNINDVSSGVTIENGEKKEGNAPTPTGSLPFNLDFDSQSAFLKSGFDIELNVPTTAAGAYIQLKSADGTIAPNYFDVALNTFNPGPKTAPKRTMGQKKVTDNTKETIEVNFGDAIPPGKFCYFICIYDFSGNISAPEEVCVEVESWGGNNEAVGLWNYVKDEETEDGITTITLKGEMSCGDGIIYCSDTQNSIDVPEAYCYTTNELTLELNSDGTFRYDINSDDKDLDFEASQIACEAVFKYENDTDSFGIGNWAYDEEEEVLTLVEFEFTEGGSTERYDDGVLLFVNKTSLTATSLIFEETYDSYDANGNQITNSYKIYFEK